MWSRVIGLTPMILTVHPSLPTKNFKEFVAFAKAHEKELTFGSSGNGGTGHLGGELLNLSLNLKMTHIPYKGEPPSVTDLLGGRLSFMLPSLPAALPLIKAGKLHALGVGSLKRSVFAPEVPTIAEQGIPGFENVSWNALYVPAALPKDLMARLNGEFVKALKSPDVVEKLAQQGVEPVANSPEEATAYLKAETAKWATVIKAANLRAE